MKHKILIATKRKEVCRQFKTALQKEGYEIQCIRTFSEVFSLLESEQISLTLFDLKLLGWEEKHLFPSSGSDQIDSLGYVILRDCCGKIEFRDNQFRGNIELLFFKSTEIDKIVEKVDAILRSLEPALYQTVIPPADDEYYLQEIIGKSARMERVHSFIKTVADKPIDILITGETGTGKELVARSIHNNSKSINQAFVAVNCAAIPATLVESELFGHEKGAFTGATERRMGKFELADGGTLFLDEIGDMSLETQAKLLRAIETREFSRVGGGEVLSTDVRIISSTNNNLTEDVNSGKFRKDLYYRLNVDHIILPPLRERKADIPLLVEHFMRSNRKKGSRVQYISPEALSTLLRYHWPGNVRELKNTIQRAVTYSEHDAILMEHLSPYIHDMVGEESPDLFENRLRQVAANCTLDDFPDNVMGKLEKILILKIWSLTNGNQKLTARKLGVSINTLKKRMRQDAVETTPGSSGN